MREMTWTHGLPGMVAVLAIAVLLSHCINDPADPPPSTPQQQSLAATADSSTAVSFTWQTVDNADSYIVFRNGSAVDTISAPPFVDSNLSGGTEYFYQVAALNAHGSSALSATAQVITPPAAPSGAIVTDLLQTGIIVSWSPASGATEYVIYRSSNGGAAIALDTIAATTFSDTALTACAEYLFTVTALGAGGESAPSAYSLPIVYQPAPIPGNGLTVKSPNGCESYHVGDTMSFTWENDSGQAALVIEFSSNNDLSSLQIGWVPLGTPAYARGPFLWEIPDTLWNPDSSIVIPTKSDSCVVTVHEYLAGGFSDKSDRPIRVLGRE